MQERWGEAARRLAGVLNDDTFRSIEGKSKHQLWLELCDLITKHPADVLKEGIDVDAILRGGIRKYKDEVGANSMSGGGWGMGGWGGARWWVGVAGWFVFVWVTRGGGLPLAGCVGGRWALTLGG